MSLLCFSPIPVCSSLRHKLIDILWVQIFFMRFNGVWYPSCDGTGEELQIQSSFKCKIQLKCGIQYFYALRIPTRGGGRCKVFLWLEGNIWECKITVKCFIPYLNLLFFLFKLPLNNSHVYLRGTVQDKIIFGL